MRTLEKPVGVVGAGSVAAGVIQVLAEAGFQVQLYDRSPMQAESAHASACEMIDRKASKGRITADIARGAKAGIRIAPGIGDLRQCGIVLESTLAPLNIIQELLAELESVLDSHAVIAINTSSVPVTVIAEKAISPHRIAGAHFFDPVPLMRIVEIIPGLRTAPHVINLLEGLVERIGHQAIHVSDSPGFLVNHAGRALLTEGSRIVSERIAEPHVVDTVLRDSVGLRMGPFELLDLVGLDVSLPVMEEIYSQFYQEARFRPAPFLSLRRAAGLLGRKTGEGFYKNGGTRVAGSPASLTEAELPPVWVDQADPIMAARVRGHLGSASVHFDDSIKPRDHSLCIIMPIGADTTTTVVKKGLDARRTVAVDALFGPAHRATVMAAPILNMQMRASAQVMFCRAGPMSWIEDSPGFIAQRTVSMIVNVACEIAQLGIARPHDIDVAVRLALGYPKGPFAMGDELGPEVVLSILQAMYDFYGDARYRPSPWLKRRAVLGIPLATTAEEN